MSDVTASYGRSFDFIAFFGYFHIHYWRVLMSKVLYLHKTFNKNMNKTCYQKKSRLFEKECSK